MSNSKKKLSTEESASLISTLKVRFDKYMNRHKSVDWSAIQTRLKAAPAKLWSLHQMETTGGEPDVVSYDKKTSEYLFFDCAAESPKGRRSICYDHQALEARKENKPLDSAVQMAEDMGIELLTEEQYRYLQQIDVFDLKTSSWILTSAPIRKLGGALFCDRRYDTVFVYHNGAESYYAARGFRGVLRV